MAKQIVEQANDPKEPKQPKKSKRAKKVKEPKQKKQKKQKKGFLEKLNDLRIEKRLRKAFLYIALLASASGVISIIMMAKITWDASSTMDNYGFATGDMGRALVSVTDTRRCVRDIIHAADEADAAQAKEELEKALKEFNSNFKKVKRTIHDSEGKDLIREIEAELTQYRTQLNRFAAIGSNDAMDSALAQQQMKSGLDPYYDKLYKACDKLLKDKIKRGKAIQTEFIILSVIALVCVIVVIAIAMLFSTKLGKIIARKIALPLRDTIDAAEQIAKGNLEIQVNIDSDDEVGDLNRVFLQMSQVLTNIIRDVNYLLKQMAEGNFNISSEHTEDYVGDFAPILVSVQDINNKLSLALSDINEATVQFSGASGSLADTATGLASGASDQAIAVNKLIETTDKVTREVENSSRSVSMTEERMVIVGKMAEESRNKMNALEKAMEKINESSKAIAEIATTIEEIADETALLSLNASIEAARAGEAGRGFAVVAGEIGKLANQSAEAVNDTKKLIDTSLEHVSDGNVIAGQTTEALQNMLKELESAVEIAKEATAAAEAQTTAIQEMDAGMSKISAVVEENSATAQTTSATSQELSAQANMLSELVSKFKLKENI